LHGVSNALNGCSASLPGNAQAKISVLNRSGSQQTLTLHGVLGVAHSPAFDYDTSYTVPNFTITACSGTPPGTCTCSGGLACRCNDSAFYGLPVCDVTVGDTVPGLAPGEWVHDITVPATGQTQYHRDLLVSDPTVPNPVSWTVFKTVLTVTKGADDGTTGTLRNAISSATPSLAPVLIRFDPLQFADGVITLTQTAALTISAANTVLDGTGSQGDPSPIAAFADRTYPVTVRTDPTNKGLAFVGDFDLTAANISLVGLSMRRVLGSDTEITGKDQNLVVPAASSAGSRISTCLLDGGAADRTDANGAEGATVPAQGKDCVDADNTEATSSNPVTIENSELRFCYDRGVKSKRGYLTVKDSWVHNNLRGGLFAQTGETLVVGTVNATNSLLEQDGVNCPNGAADTFSGNLADCGTQTVARLDASEISAHETTSNKLSRIETNGNVIRDGAAQGLYFQNYSTGAVSNDYVCGMHRPEVSNPKGILIKRTLGAPSDISVAGTGVVYNTEGMKLDGTVSAVFGTDAAPGRNSFTQNGTTSIAKKNFINVNSIAGVTARGNEWQNCYTSETNRNYCKIGSILSYDVKNSVDVGTAAPAPAPPDSCDPAHGCEPHQALGTVLPLQVNSNGVYPTKASEAGAIVHVAGTGFDAVSGHTGQSSGNCEALKQTNTCTPTLQGTCVEFGVDDVFTEASDVLAVTPTHLVVTSPFPCAKGAKVRVTRKDANGNPLSYTTPGPVFCVNP
jgi:hypothetical protein